MRGDGVRMAVRGRGGRPGFSLIEMLIVVAIIALIATLVATNVIGGFGKSQVNITKAKLASLTGDVEKFRLDVGRFPTEQEGLQALITKPSGADQWAGPYLRSTALPTDGWGRPFIYRTTDDSYGFKIVSLGADGREGGEGENADLDNRS